ncbi:MAG: hypothetical protein L0241_06910, partial [Planctomycetia bacterium]|nr:hypothetical protein [Planctomycetia bacterium]
AVEGLKLDPAHESLFRWKGWAEHKLGLHDEALASAHEGLKQHPNSHLLLNLIGCIKWTLAEKHWGRRRFRMHRKADAVLRESVRLDPMQSAYRDNLRGNAVSCRRHFLRRALLILYLAVGLIPANVLAFTVLWSVNMAAGIVTAFASVVCLLIMLAINPSEQCVLAAPLDRFCGCSVPLSPKDYRDGFGALCEYGLLILVPYGVWIWAYLWRLVQN